MDYKEFAEHPDFSSRAKVAEWVETAATVIVKLLARAEAAEARVHELETTHRTEMCSDGYDCVQLGKARKAAADAEARAEKAEKEIKRLRDIMWNKGFVPFPADDYESEKEE